LRKASIQYQGCLKKDVTHAAIIKKPKQKTEPGTLREESKKNWLQIQLQIVTKVKNLQITTWLNRLPKSEQK